MVVGCLGGEVSRAKQKLLAPLAAWRTWSLAVEKFLYLFLDGTNFAMRRSDEVVKQGVLVVINVNEKRQRQVLALQAGDKESRTAWKALFAHLIRRGLDPSTIQLGILDGLPGLEDASLATFGRGKLQRCQFHRAQNGLAKMRKKDCKIVAEDLQRVFCAGDARGAKRALRGNSGLVAGAILVPGARGAPVLPARSRPRPTTLCAWPPA